MAGVGEKMMVGAFTGLLSPLLGKLTKLMEEKYAQIKSVRKKVKSLQKDLVCINIALEQYAEMERPDKQVKLWMDELREMAYNMEDCVDDFMYRVGVHHEPADIKGFLQEQFCKLKTLPYRSKFAKQIQELKAEVDEAYARYKQYKTDGSESSAKIDPRLSELHVEMKKLVGIEGPIEEIISRFNVNKTGPVNQHRVISIVGPGGSGKTTLAYQVYERIKDQFSCACFVSLSQKPNMRTILNDFLSKAGSSGSTTDSVQRLIERLRALLENKKYLIVIDDIWGTSDWNSIKSAIPENVHASRIITTTRNKNIAEICCTSKEDFVYPMKLLSQSDSKKLFLKRTFDAEDECPGQLEGIINEVLRKCDGLPLAIVTLASLLATKQGREEEWIRVLKSIRSIEGKDEKLEVMDSILALSYNDLPYHLKACLLSLSMFPEDCKIDKYSLVWRWIAEGFVVSVGDCTFQEVGERYFNELINRSLIQPISSQFDGEVSACRVHDIVLDFIVSRSTEENFVNSILDGQYTPSQRDKIRRLYIQNSNGLALETLQQNVDLSHLRALNVFSAVTWMPPLSGKNFLRVLDLDGCDTLKDDDLKNIRSLIQLRYLGLRDTEIKNLPIQFNKLRFLQTLDIRGTEIRKLPQAIVELKRLVRLLGHELTLPDGFGKMEALEELEGIDVNSITVNFSKDLGDLTRLRKLAFWSSHALPQDTIIKPFMSPNSIRSLEIKGVHGDAEFFMDPWYSPPRLLQKFVLQPWHSNPVRFSFYRFPKWINSSLCNLTYLALHVEHMHSTDMHMLQSLPALCWLLLAVHYISEEAGLSVSHDGFQQLTHLMFHYEYGTGLRFEAGAMRKLQKLFFGFNLAEAKRTYGGVGPFFFGIQHLISLNHIEVDVYARGLADDAESSEIYWDVVVGNISDEIKSHPFPQNPKYWIRLHPPSKNTSYVIPTQNLECTNQFI